MPNFARLGTLPSFKAAVLPVAWDDLWLVLLLCHPLGSQILSPVCRAARGWLYHYSRGSAVAAVMVWGPKTTQFFVFCLCKPEGGVFIQHVHVCWLMKWRGHITTFPPNRGTVHEIKH